MKTFTAYLPKNGNFRKSGIKAYMCVSGHVESDVVQLQAENLEHVYAQLNHGSGCELEGYKGRSLSVGDVVVSPEGETFMVDSFGWRKL